MILYHFTTRLHLDSIEEHGLCSINRKRRDGLTVYGTVPPPAFPQEDDLIWLTRDPAPPTCGLWSSQVRVTVDTPRARRWRKMIDRYKVPRDWVRILRDSGGGDQDWFVAEHHIPAGEIVSIEPVQLGSLMRAHAIKELG